LAGLAREAENLLNRIFAGVSLRQFFVKDWKWAEMPKNPAASFMPPRQLESAKSFTAKSHEKSNVGPFHMGVAP
jgi:hypothetical protein